MQRFRNPISSGFQVFAERPEKVRLCENNNMRFLIRWAAYRRMFAVLGCLVVLSLMLLSLSLMDTRTDRHATWTVDLKHKKLLHQHVHDVLQGQCRPHGTRKDLLTRLPASSHKTHPFLWRNEPISDTLFLYPLPFGFRGLQTKVERLQRLLPASDSVTEPVHTSSQCRRCVVVGNGGILKGLELGSLIDRFDTIIRLNSGPLGQFSVDVGNRTSIRLSYPESTPVDWVDTDPLTVFVAVLYKGVDLSWTSAMINKLPVPLWDWLFFWKKVPDQIPLDSSRFRILNPQVIKEAALDLLKYPPPRFHLWGWDQNIPTLGVSALNLASLLCDEVSLAGFGYNLTQQGASLHYYDHLPMSFMQGQKMHDVNKETELLQSLVREGTLTDLTGGIHCSFCTS
ncbi:lactosylceramide alpha-2,3-sialyltransferase [Gouania willdenowi]|uniref:Lactosylceramide alpha-2,3-sialyltransferase n=1 Tax=Gouania willdenowi TaxID=441366 RepID=A0A8C5GLX8_GOUWI|nr:lactosylceramide alpha-2,3-sialyltransferase [Gouania willdenowi]